RATALRGIANTRFYPDWGQARLHGMISNRPDWTLSRQRQWGVPMPFFIHRETSELHPRTLELLEQVAERVETGGIEAWQTLDPKELLGAEAEQYVKIKDTLDVWFDSGSTHQTVMGGPDGKTSGAGSHGMDLQFPADLYLEGSDQHRGWFHSSLLVSCMLNGEPPYKALLTHGFFVDGQGRKMSKSLGNTLEPQKISGSLGAEILRLWVAATDYSGELSISDEILKRVVESYRRIRNTLRFLLANTADFDPRAHALPVEDWLEIDRYALALTQSMQQEEARVAGKIGSSLQAEVEIRASGDKLALLQSLEDDLRFVLITSSAVLTPVAAAADEAVIVSASARVKCERCWHYRDDVGEDAAHAGLCGRCVSNLYGAGEARAHA
ncbi:MAG: class I tRNA ligase family protein, partial [Betaproteobacteria bacterium]|nr:class I tRNA ligase family protein [Betaproteobacteria bacterium]